MDHKNLDRYCNPTIPWSRALEQLESHIFVSPAPTTAFKEGRSMTSDVIRATKTIKASAEIIFAVLADPTKHPAIAGGTSAAPLARVREPLDREPISAPGQIFGMAMFHPDHPNGDYEIANQVTVFERPRAIAWKPGYDAGGGTLGFGGWIWRYDLIALGPSETEVTLSYDWSSVPDPVRQHVGFPPFSAKPPFWRDDLGQSLTHLAELVTT